MIMLLHIPYYLNTILRHVFLDVGVCAYGSPQYLDTLHGKHVQSKIILNVLKAWVILQKKFSPIIHVPSCGTLSQEHGFVQVKIKIAIKFENMFRYCDESQSLGNPSYNVTIISEG